MAHTLKYTVLNASLAPQQREVEIPGVGTANATYTRAVIELAPDDHEGGLVKLVLPEAALSDFPEGALVALSVSIEGA